MRSSCRPDRRILRPLRPTHNALAQPRIRTELVFAISTLADDDYRGGAMVAKAKGAAIPLVLGDTYDFDTAHNCRYGLSVRFEQ